MPKSNVGKSSELAVHSFLHPYHTFCSFVQLFLIGYYNLFCEKSCKLYIYPCASMFCLTCSWLLRGFWFQSLLDLLDQGRLLGMWTHSSPSPPTIVHRVPEAVRLLPTPSLLMITMSLEITEFALQLHHIRNGFFTIALLGSSQSSQDRLHVKALDRQQWKVVLSLSTWWM